MGIWIAIGVAIGAAIGAAVNQTAMGVAFGAAKVHWAIRVAGLGSLAPSSSPD